MFCKIVRFAEFEKDIKRLKKRFRTIEDDLDVFAESGQPGDRGLDVAALVPAGHDNRGREFRAT